MRVVKGGRGGLLDEYAVVMEDCMFYHSLAQLTAMSPELGIEPGIRTLPKSSQEEYLLLSHAAASHPRLELETISIVQFDCLNQTDLLQIHLSFDKSITVSFR